jgi:hypothetical protein
LKRFLVMLLLARRNNPAVPCLLLFLCHWIKAWPIWLFEMFGAHWNVETPRYSQFKFALCVTFPSISWDVKFVVGFNDCSCYAVGVKGCTLACNMLRTGQRLNDGRFAWFGLESGWVRLVLKATTLARTWNLKMGNFKWRTWKKQQGVHFLNFCSWWSRHHPCCLSKMILLLLLSNELGYR